MTTPSTQLVLRAGAATDRGQLRTINQDAVLMLPDLSLFVVADGMGGAQGGEIASRMAVDILREVYVDAGASALTEAIAEANRRIHDASDNPSLRGMGTTAVILVVVPEEPDSETGDAPGEPSQHLLVANVGDSRAYLFRDGGLTQLTDDHLVVAELVRDGRITSEEAEAHPQRNIITRVLGVYPEVHPDLWPIDPVRGDRYLLCSDGLFNEVSDSQMSAALRRLSDPTEAAEELVRLANEGGGRDNITVIVIDVIDDAGLAATASAALAGEQRVASRPTESDPLGFSAAVSTHKDAVALSGKARRQQRRAARKEAKLRRTRLTWRVLAFALLVVGVIGGALATIQWYGTSTYFVGFDRNEVAIFQGRPGGLLWVDPVVKQDTGIMRDEVPDRYLAAITAGHQHATLSDAKVYISNIERDIDIVSRATTTTTTTETTETTAASSSSSTSATTTTTVTAN